MFKRHAFAAAVLAVTAFVGLAAPASAHGRHDNNRHSDRSHGHHDDNGNHGHHHGRDNNCGNPCGDQGEPPGTVTVVADNLNNPRQVTAHDGAVYVAEAGTGGDTCFGSPPNQACVGFTGSVTRVGSGGPERVQTGLLSVASPEGDTRTSRPARPVPRRL